MSLREEILKLKESNDKLSYRAIAKLLGCSKTVVSYHLNTTQKDKSKQRVYKRRKLHSYIRKLETFLSRQVKNGFKQITVGSNNDKIYNKIRDFHKKGKTKEIVTMSFTYKDVIDKFGEHPKCYLTGKEIDLSKPRSYHFDHIIPSSKGGDNTIDNLGICTKEANMAKSDLTYDELIELCKNILDTHNSKENITRL